MTPDTTAFDLEAALGRSLAFAVPISSRATIDGRVNAAMAAESTRRAQPQRRPLRRPRRVLLGIAAAVVLTGTVAAGGTLLSQLRTHAPLLQSMWDRSTQIGQSATDSGYTIVLERATADPERVWVAVTVTAASGTGADPGRMQVIDANGAVYDGGTGAGAEDLRGTTAMIFGFKVPEGTTPLGPFTLEVTSVTTATGETTGHWSFAFDVPLTPAAGRVPASATPTPRVP
jgi:hypothetical protein